MKDVQPKLQGCLDHNVITKTSAKWTVYPTVRVSVQPAMKILNTLLMIICKRSTRVSASVGLQRPEFARRRPLLQPLWR